MLAAAVLNLAAIGHRFAMILYSPVMIPTGRVVLEMTRAGNL